MTAPDPRVGEIEARLFHLGYVVEHGSSDALHVALGEDVAYLLAELRDREGKLARVLEIVESKAARWESVAAARESDNLIERDPEIWLENRTRSITLRANAHNIRAAVAASGGGGEDV